LGDEKYREKLVSEIYAGEKPGILGVFGWVTRNIERNPVSEDLLYIAFLKRGEVCLMPYAHGNLYPRRPMAHSTSYQSTERL